MVALKILIILALSLLLFFPLLPLPLKMRRFSTFRALRYDAPHNRLNLFFVILTLFEFIIFAILFLFFKNIINTVLAWGFIKKLLAGASSKMAFITFMLTALLINLLALYVLVFIKGIFKPLLNRVFGIPSPEKEKKKKKKEEKAAKKKKKRNKKEKKEKKEKKKRRIPVFFHSEDPEEDEENADDKTTAEEKAERFEEAHPILFKIYHGFWSLFFEGEDFRYMRRWVVRVQSVLQYFIYFVEIAYFLFFFGVLLTMFFAVPAPIYAILNAIKDRFYVYPFLSILLLQEVVNTLKAEIKKEETGLETLIRKEEEEKKKKEARLEELRAKLLRRFGTEHHIRCYPEIPERAAADYECMNKTYRDALVYIREQMKVSFGRAVQSYMEGLDYVFNGRHVYFGASFYSQLSEYIITYTYIRLLSGERQIFIVSDRGQVDSLIKFIGRRLTELTGTTDKNTWRVYNAEANINEADVLVAVPEDFETDNLVENYPTFFEETCNAIFIDADRILNLNSYLCTILASRLQVATRDRIRFLFMSTDIIQGLADSLKKFFRIPADDSIVECSSSEENESVSYMLWNRESEIVYHRDGQRLATLEGMIADAAHHADVDGIRILTSVPLSAAEKEEFISHRIEINEFHKEVPEVNYMICTDDRCNLAAAVYAYTRFHGKRASVLHILSKPYLLREYFVSKAEEYVNRSAFIKPRATEHADTDKLMMLRILCDATSNSNGMLLSEFSEKIAKALTKAKYPAARGTADEVAFLIESLTGEVQTKIFDNEEKLCSVKDYRDALRAGKDVSEWHTLAQNPMHEYFGVLNAATENGYQVGGCRQYITFLKLDSIFSKLLRHNRRVELYLNASLLGRLDTFPERVHQQYLPGQSIIFNNVEYEIESIASDGSAIYLRRQNITFNSCMDTVLLRRYRVENEVRTEDTTPSIYNYRSANTEDGELEEIQLEYRTAHIYGETYGFYRLMSNSQKLDFMGHVVGNPLVDEKIVKAQARDIKDGKILSVRLLAHGETCTDGMRRLLAAVFSEFLRTMFPEACRCIAVCPVLKEPTDASHVENNFNKQVETVYPYLIPVEATAAKATDDSVELLIINDAVEDIGVLAMLHDGEARIIEEILSYIIDYLKWLKANETLPEGESHYIYFGADKLPEIYELDGCIKLLENCERKFKEEETVDVRKEEFCSFCHRKLVPGRYSSFDKHRFICFECEVTVVSDPDALSDIYDKVCAYLKEKYPKVSIPEDVTVGFDGLYDTDKERAKDPHYYAIEPDNRKILVERDNPETNVFSSILRGLIYFWQKDNRLLVGASEAQLAYEEMLYLNSIERPDTASYVEEILDAESKTYLDEIRAAIAANADSTSFDYMLAILETIEEEEDIVPDPIADDDDEGSDALFDPDLVPRFWKRYLRGEHATDGEEKSDNLLPESRYGFVKLHAFNSPADGEDEYEDEDEEYEDDELTEEEESEEEESEEEDTVEEDETSDEEPDTKKKPSKEKKEKKDKTDKAEKAEKKEKQKKIGPGKLSHLKSGIELIPHEAEEDRNPRIRLYNEIARHIADYSNEPISIAGFSDEEISRIYHFVYLDYPEFFWIRGYGWTGGSNPTMTISYRLTIGDTEKVDVAKVVKYRKELRRRVNFFTKGITRGTKPYDAMLIIYRRLILNLDYEGVGLDSGAGRDRGEDDTLRSLYSALVKKKVVCAGYAVAMQYLLQSVGICCGSIVSQTHEWNVVKFGRYCYHLDATWGDNSNTKNAGKDLDKIFYNYCCVPTEMNNRAGAERVPDTKIFKDVEDFTAVKHDYFRMKNAYLASYDEDQMAKVLANTVQEKPFEGAARCMAFRCRDRRTFDTVLATLAGSAFQRIREKARAIVGAKDKKALKLIDKPFVFYQDEKLYTVHCYFEK